MDSCKITQISSHLFCCVDFIFWQEFHGTIPWFWEISLRYGVRGHVSWGLVPYFAWNMAQRTSESCNKYFLWGHMIQKLFNYCYAQNCCNIILYTALILVYHMRPVTINKFCLFLDRSVWYNSKQCQMFWTKKSVGGFCRVSLDIVRLDI